MTLQSTDAGEPTIIALVDAVKAWQRALDTTLSASGLNYVKWILLRGIARGDYVRRQPYVSAVLLDVEMAERLLGELYREHWIAFVDHAGYACGPTAAEGQPMIAEHQRRRIERISLSVKALHSVSVSPLGIDDRAALCRLLEKMQHTLNEHSNRQHPREEAIDVGVAPLIRAHTMMGASETAPAHAAAAGRRGRMTPSRSRSIPWRG